MSEDVKIERVDTNCEAISRFVLPALPDDITLAAVQAIRKDDIIRMDAEQTAEYLRGCFKFSRFVSQDAAQHFIDLFRAAKKAHKLFCGYKEFNLAAFEMTGYTGNRLRQIARGDVPKNPPVPLSPEENERRAAKKIMAARIEGEIRAKDKATAAARKEEADLKKDGGSTKNPARESVAAANNVVTESESSLTKAISIFQMIVFSLRAMVISGPGSKELKNSLTVATAFLKDHEAFTAPPAPVKKKTTAEVKAESEAALKNQPSQASTSDSDFSNSNPAADAAAA